MLSDREKVVVGTALLVVLATVVTACLLLFAGGGKAPSSGSPSALAENQTMANGQSAPSQQQLSTLMGQDPQQEAALQKEAQALLQQQAAQTSPNSSGTNTQRTRTKPSGSSIAGSWSLTVQGNVYSFPAMPVTLNEDGTVSLAGATSSYVSIRSSHYTFNASTRAIQIDCECVITMPQAGTMPVSLQMKGTFDSGLTQANGTFTATSSSNPTDQGTFKLFY